MSERLRFHLDEHMDPDIAAALARFGIDASTTVGQRSESLVDILHRVGELVLDAGCAAADAWYVAAAIHTQATFWMSHEHRDELASIAAKYVQVGVLSKQPASF